MHLANLVEIIGAEIKHKPERNECDNDNRRRSSAKDVEIYECLDDCDDDCDDGRQNQLDVFDGNYQSNDNKIKPTP